MASPYRVRSTKTSTQIIAPSVNAASAKAPVQAANPRARVQSIVDSQLLQVQEGGVNPASYAANARQLSLDKKPVMSGEQTGKATCADKPLNQAASVSAHGQAESSMARTQSIATRQLSRQEEADLNRMMYHLELSRRNPQELIRKGLEEYAVRRNLERSIYEGSARFSTPLTFEGALTALIRQESRRLASVRMKSDNRPVYDMSITFPCRDAHFRQNSIDMKRAVSTLKDEKLLSLESTYFLWIVDFLTPDQCQTVLLSSKCVEWKLALYYYSPALAVTIGARQQEVWSQPVNEDVRRLARTYREQAAKYTADEFNLVLDRSELLNSMKTSSSTLVLAQASKGGSQTGGLANKDQICWETTLRGDLPDPKLDQISIKWLIEKHEKIVQLEYSGDRELRMPGTSVEEIIPSKHFFSPGRIVREQMEGYCEWLNRELENCRKGSACPIVTAALAYMRFISIHPFIDGNGRMGRLISDSILRSFQLLPAIWNNHKMIILPFGSDSEVTPTIAVVNMLEALDRSYKLTKDLLV